jgi:hypothetical protein
VAPILVHFHPEKPTVVETDASDFAHGAVLSQIQETKRLHPVAYHSRKFKPAEINYDVHDKEMLAIVTAFKEWEHMLKSVAGGITVTPTVRIWSILPPQKSRPDGKRVGQSTSPSSISRSFTDPARRTQKADVLSRRWDHALKEGSEASPVSFF